MKRVISVLGLCFFVVGVFAQTSDSTIIKTRLGSLKSSVPLKYTTEMWQYLSPLIANQNNRTADMIFEARKFLPYIENVVKEKKMPHALTYLPYVVTGYVNEHNPDDGRIGVWNLPYAVARKYDLLMNSYIDERYNVVTSTESAMDYLVDLKHEFNNDWQLAILAFCTSPTNVLQHMYKAGNAKTYEEIYCDLDASERRFLDQLTAATYIFSFYGEKDIAIRIRTLEETYAADTVDIFRKLTFEKIAQATGIDKQVLRGLNPIYKLEIVPFNEAPHSLIIPKGYKQTFDSLLQNYPNTEASRPTNDAPLILHDSDIAKPSQAVITAANAGAKKVPVYYKVKSGDNLYGIADLFDCKSTDLKRWNKFSRNYLIAGQTLVFYVPSNKKAKYQKMNAMTAKQKRVLIYQD
ncbi:MAG: LysM peptidoglycan-binding domain-containing protein [Bacteroidetes bacterium]|nr:LysM peptidoglycan-binding domain-containing protein [Bacteroidota bacterium]